MASECQYCALKLDFELDEHLWGEIERQRCVIFAGAGISTETTGAHATSLYETIKSHVVTKGDERFPEIVDLFEDQPNGRQKFIEEVRARFDYINGWRDLKGAATKFHRSIATAPCFHQIITTNWDRYFEDIIKATPFVYDSDLAFWQDCRRPLLKIHGSIDNLSTLVASSADYQACEDRLRNGPLGDILRHIFATQTVIFVGYSISDSDFQSIYRSVRKSTGRLARTHYLISPFLDDHQIMTLGEDLGIVGIKTDATHFVETVKGHMRERYFYAFDESYERIMAKLIEVTDEHLRFTSSYSVDNESHLIFATSYQDGLIHCLQRIVDHRFTNEYASLHHVRRQADLYNQRAKAYSQRRDYWNASYFSGYETGLIYFDIVNADLNAEEVPIDLLDLPIYYHPGLGHLNKSEYEALVRPHPEVHKTAHRQSLRFKERFKGSPDIVVQHTPFG